jgi:histidine ammonia-lyase
MPLESSPALQEAHRRIRSRIKRLDQDRILSADIEASTDLIRSDELLLAVESVLQHAL